MNGIKLVNRVTMTRRESNRKELIRNERLHRKKKMTLVKKKRRKNPSRNWVAVPIYILRIL